MALHEQSVGKTDEWYTPKYVFDALGCRYDMDVAAPQVRTYVSTPTSRFLCSDSLEIDWDGFVWMNPPFGKRNGLIPWLEKFFAHGNGIALTPDRTSAPWWQQFAPRSDLVLAVSGKIEFIGVDGQPGTSPAQGTTLLAAGTAAVEAIVRAARAGLGSPFRPLSLPSHDRAPQGE